MKLIKTTTVEGKCVSFKDKRLVRILPAVDRNDCIIKNQLDDEVDNLKQEINFLNGIVDKLVSDDKDSTLDLVLSGLRDDYMNWRDTRNKQT